MGSRPGDGRSTARRQFNVQIDRDGNGTADTQAFTTRFTFGPNADPQDVFVVAAGAPVAAVGYTNVFNSNVSRFWGTIETTPWLPYNVAAPGLTFSDGLGGTTIYPALDGQKIGVGYDDAAFTANGSQGVLLLHHFNQSGKRAEVLSIKK